VLAARRYRDFEYELIIWITQQRTPKKVDRLSLSDGTEIIDDGSNLRPS
jgi:hypothetical protein